MSSPVSSSPREAVESTPLLRDDRLQAASRSNGTPTAAHGSEPSPATIVMPPYKTLIPVLAALWVPVFISSLDGTIVATLVGSISSSFNASEHASWFGTSFLLALICINPLMGRMADFFGTRTSSFVSIALFSLGTFACAIAPGVSTFLIGRVIQGAGAGGLTTISNIHMSKIVPLRNRGLFQGLTNIVFGLGSGSGGPIGGLANDTVGWRAAFLIQCPFLVIASILSFRYVHEVEQFSTANLNLPIRDKIKRIDFLGSITLVGFAALLLIPLSLVSGSGRSFKEPFIFSQIILGLAFGIAFLYIEALVASHPVLPFDLLKNRTGISVAVTNFTLSINTFATLFTYPIYFQVVRLTSATQAGLHLMPYSIALAVSSMAAGYWMRYTGHFKKYNVVMAALQLVSAIVISRLEPTSPDWLTYLAIVPMGWGGAGNLVCSLIGIINNVSQERMAVATAMTYLFRTTGQALGVSLAGFVLQSSLKVELEKRIDDRNLIKEIRHAITTVQTLPPGTRARVVEAFSVSVRNVFLVMTGVCVVTLLGSLLMEDKPLPEERKRSNSESGEDGRGGGRNEPERDHSD